MRYFNNWTALVHRHMGRRRTRGLSFRLEVLEDRFALSGFLVSNLGDSGDGSLRQAIALSNGTPGPNEIDFASGLSGTITLTSGQLAIANNDVTIVGPGADVLSVSGNNAGRVFDVDGVQAAISGLAITGGNVSSFGEGGGILSFRATMTLVGCTISGNSAGIGGGILNIMGTMTLADCTISDNSVSGIENAGGAVTLAGCTISGNSGFSGIGNDSNNGTMTLAGCTISGNSGGGIRNFGTMTLADCALNGNSGVNGGGINNSGTMTLAECMLNGNSATSGGGIYNSGLLAIAGGTIGDNTASVAGGGIYNIGGGVAIAGSIIRHNHAALGGGIYNSSGGVLSLIANDISDNDGGDIVG